VDRLNCGLIRRDGRQIGFGDPAIFAVKRNALTRRNECDVRRWRFAERRRNHKERQQSGQGALHKATAFYQAGG